MHFPSYITILRPINGFMAGGAVMLGAWISGSPLQWHNIIVLSIVTFMATGFGNLINDIIDIETDRISHPTRPLPSKKISRKEAIVYCIILSLISITAAGMTGFIYGIATLVPLTMLTLYAFFLKGTPFIGNVIVSVLVAYALLFGSLEAPHLNLLVIPAALAMLLNFSREVVKDIQDRDGDRAAGITTTASVSLHHLKMLLLAVSLLYIFILAVTLFLRIYGTPYSLVVIAGVIPLHMVRLFHLGKRNWTDRAGLLSALIKAEMLGGLLALAINRLCAT